MGQVNSDNIYDAAGTGGPSLPKMPYVKANLTGATYSAGTTALALTEVTDVANNFSSNTFTAPTAGRYFVTLNLALGTVTGAVKDVRAKLLVNAVAVLERFPLLIDNVGTATLVANATSSYASTVLDLAANDTVAFSIVIGSGTSVVFDTSTYTVMTISKIA